MDNCQQDVSGQLGAKAGERGARKINPPARGRELDLVLDLGFLGGHLVCEDGLATGHVRVVVRKYLLALGVDLRFDIVAAVLLDAMFDVVESGFPHLNGQKRSALLLVSRKGKR